MRKYEGMFIIKPDTDEEKQKKLLDSITKSITKNGGRLVSSDRLGKRRLAYPIKRCREGIYYRLEFDIEPKFISALKRDYRLKEDIVRELIIAKEA